MPRENPAFCTQVMAILAIERFLLLCRVRATNLALRGFLLQCRVGGRPSQLRGFYTLALGRTSALSKSSPKQRHCHPNTPREHHPHAEREIYSLCRGKVVLPEEEAATNSLLNTRGLPLCAERDVHPRSARKWPLSTASGVKCKVLTLTVARRQQKCAASKLYNTVPVNS